MPETEPVNPNTAARFGRRAAALAFMKSTMLDGADQADAAAAAMRARVKKANEAVHAAIPTRRGIFAGLQHFSVRDAAKDAYTGKQDNHKAFAKARVDKFMATKFVTRYPGQTFGERKSALFDNFKSALSAFKDAGILKGDLKQIRRETKQSQREAMTLLRERKAAAAMHVYDAAVEAGKIVPVNDPKLTKAHQVQIAMGDNPELRKAARALRDEIRVEMKARKSEFGTQNAQVKAAITKISNGDRSAARLIGKLFNVGVQGAVALNVSRKNNDDKTSYAVRRVGGRILLESSLATRKVGAVVAGAKDAVGAGTVETLGKVAHVASNVTHAVTAPLRRTTTSMA